MKKIISVFLVALSVFLFSSCNRSLPEVTDCDIIHEPEFGGVYIKKTIEEFNNMGYEFGDSVNVKFSNGYELIDLPYFSGYYVDAGTKLLVGYPGYDYIKVAINYGDDMWDIAKLNEGDKASVRLNTKHKYKDLQDASDIHYYDEREKYTSDEEFANFRNINVGNIKEGILYRSASPCDNKHKRASYVDKLIEKANVDFILNLADTDEKIEGYIESPDFNSPYFLSLYRYKKNNLKLLFASKTFQKYSALAMNMNYKSQEFGQTLASGFINMLDSDGPYLVHCLEGKDRTGFVCIVLEALCGATYQEIVDDYMVTYKNYYGIDSKDNRYEILKKRNVDAMLQFIVGDNVDIRKDSLSKPTANYLIQLGMTDTQIEDLINKLCK